MNGQSYKLLLSTIKERETSLYINEKTFTKWRLQQGETLTITAGQRSTSVKVFSFPSAKRECKLSISLVEFLSLPDFNHPVQLTLFHSLKKVFIGPFLAILTNGTLLENGTFGDMEAFLQEMKTYCQEKGFPLYIATLQSLHNGDITGFWPHDKEWKAQKLPIADVFYNRIHSRRLEKSTGFNHFKSDLTHYNIVMFNTEFLSKLDVYELLSKEETLHPNLPPSIPFLHQDDLHLFLQQYSSLYIKPIFGSQGRHISKVTKVKEGWVIEHSSHTQESQFVDSEEKLFHLLKNFCKNRSYILQKGIPLLEWEHKKVDFRILLHQTVDDWKVTSIVARIGDSGHIVSNVAQGAEMKNGAQFLKEKFDSSQAQLLQQTLIKLAKKTAYYLSKNYPGLLVELGIDLALDEELYPWIIEVNSKPSKKFEGNYDKFRPSVKALIDCMNMYYEKNRG